MIYLAGCITYLENQGKLHEAIEWRKTAQERLEDSGFQVFNPMINYEMNKSYANYSPKTVVHQNTHYLNKSDILLVNLNDLEHSPGTMFEMFYAYLHNKPIVAFGYTDIFFQPHINESITYHALDLEHALEHIFSMYHS